MIGFIGCGNMAKAVIKGMIEGMNISPNQIIASAKSEQTVNLAKETFHIQATTDNIEVVKQSKILFLAIKPIFAKEVIEEIRDHIQKDVLIVSLMAGITLSRLEEAFEKSCKFIRTMPNTPALVGAGMTAICPGELVTDEELSKVRSIFQSFGNEEVVPERLMDVVTAVSGSSPAWVFEFIEAMADAAVADGLPRAQAYRFAAQAVLGSAKMVLETGEHPAVLKDQVCSPGGTTIEAICVLEEKGMRSAVIEASKACVRKAKEL